jgi:hypothetical protein
MKNSFTGGMFVGFVCAYIIMIGISYAHNNEFILSRDDSAVENEEFTQDDGFSEEEELVASGQAISARDGRRVSRSTMCNDCMDGMGKILYDISYLSSVLADVQEKLLDTVYGYAKKRKAGFLADGSRQQLHSFHANLLDVHTKATEAIIAANQLISVFNTL